MRQRRKRSVLFTACGWRGVRVATITELPNILRTTTYEVELRIAI